MNEPTPKSIKDAMNAVDDSTIEYRRTVGDRALESENSVDALISAIDSYATSLREAIQLKEELPKNNCIREIRSRLRKLSKMDPSLEEQKRSTLNQEFPGEFI